MKKSGNMKIINQIKWAIIFYCHINYSNGQHLPRGCIEYRSDLICSNSSLTKVPVIHSTIVGAYLSHNRITEIEPSKFLFASLLNELDLSFNYISSINGMTFVDLKNLVILFLGSNQITYIHPLAFKNNSKLQKLFLNNNPIHYPTNIYLLASKSLLRLSLAYSDLSEIAPATLSSLENLRNLDVRGNKLTSIWRDTLDSIPHLTELIVSDQSDLCFDKSWKNVSDYMNAKQGTIYITICPHEEITSSPDKSNIINITDSSFFHPVMTVKYVQSQSFYHIFALSVCIIVVIINLIIVVCICMKLSENNTVCKTTVPGGVRSSDNNFIGKWLSAINIKGCSWHVHATNEPRASLANSNGYEPIQACPILPSTHGPLTMVTTEVV